jgi:uncharacterized repeat protein (TIGR04076 family)
MTKCKITVLKRTLNQDLVDEYMKEKSTLCDQFKEGQEFVVEAPWAQPAGFCPWAWADLRPYIFAVATGADFPWSKRPDVTLGCCTDGYRPVVFKIERVE